MSLFLQAEVNDKDEIQNVVSPFQLNEGEEQRMTEVRLMFNVAQNVRTQSYEEFDYRDLQTILSKGEILFNANKPGKSPDPDEAWRADTKRPILRNKLISIATNVLVNLLYPTVVAQNDNSNDDKEASLVMSDLLDYRLERLKYPRLMKKIIIASLYSPATYIDMDFVDAKREIKVIQEDGTWIKEKVFDELFSGFQANIVPCEEIYPTNVYEPDLQKQIIIRRQILTYNQAKMAHGDHENWIFITAGIRNFFDADSQSFFQHYDPSQEDRLVEKVTYYDPFADLELIYIQGIPFTDPDQPLRRVDKRIPLIKTGYELISERFYYYKSGADKLMNEDELLNDMWNMVMDGTFLSIMPPTAIIGDEDIDSSVMIPGGVTILSNADSDIKGIGPSPNIIAGLNTVAELERSISESSTSSQAAGVAQKGVETANEVQTLEQNAKINLGLFSSQIAELVEDFGDMLLPLIVQHELVTRAAEMLSDPNKLAFSSILVRDREVNGKIKSRRIDFIGDVPNKDGEEEFELGILEEEDKLGISIVKANPMLLKNLKFKSKVNADPLAGKTDAVKKALGLQAYDRAIANPSGDPEALLRDFVLEPVKPGESGKYIRKAPAPEAEPQQGGGALVGNLAKEGELGIDQLT